MSQIINTVLALFSVIFLGWAIRRLGLFPGSVTSPLNKLVFYVALPILIFQKISQASFGPYFDSALVTGVGVAALAVTLLALFIGRLLGIKGKELGTFIQASIHGNLGYMGLAVAFYFLGEKGFTKASILASFMILLQNLISIIALQICSTQRGKALKWLRLAGMLFLNPIILASLAGLLFSMREMQTPGFVNRTLTILSGMALPLGLLLIGSSLSLSPSWPHLKIIAMAGFLKLLILPVIGIGIYKWLSVSSWDMLPGVILLGAPTATVTYVMAGEMGGAPSLASSIISVTTLFSGLSYLMWLSLLS